MCKKAIPLGLLCSIFLSIFPISAEAFFCASDKVEAQRLKDPAHRAIRQEVLEIVQHKLNATEGLPPSSSGLNFIIPVVVHLVKHPSDPANVYADMSDEQVLSQINALNKAFEDLWMYEGAPSPAESMNVKFCLATKWPDGSTIWPGTPGITRSESSETIHDYANPASEAALKTVDYFPSDIYLNIWVVKEILSGSPNLNVLGYATFPGGDSLLDGIVMQYDAFGDVSDPQYGSPTFDLLPDFTLGKVLVHEAGHFLDVYHTFQGGCAGMTMDTCESQGDFVCDTPPVAVSNSACDPLLNSCDETFPANYPDQINNHMDYTDDTCRNTFTEGQRHRMHAVLQGVRSQLVDPASHFAAGIECIGPIHASFQVEPAYACAGTEIECKAFYQSPDLEVYTWDFGDGTTESLTNVTTISHSYPPSGLGTVSYIITLTIETPSNTVSASKTVYIEDCTPISSSRGIWYFGFQAGLDFSSGAPVAEYSAFSNQTINTLNNSLCQADDDGNLLFYSACNITNEEVSMFWNANHEAMPNSPIMVHSDSGQYGVILPFAQDADRYRIITAEGNPPGPFFSCKETVVNMTLDGGKGDVEISSPIIVPDNLGIEYHPDGGFLPGVFITAIPSCDGDSYWVLLTLRNIDNADQIMVLSVNDSGATFSHFLSLPGVLVNGDLMFSPDGTRFARSGISRRALYT